ncbi:MAG: Holliday junction resolvase RuvX [Bacteroidia bacterium]|nr:Holliday junction resolvase RuvX [Bacteroidia bacterium]
MSRILAIDYGQKRTGLAWTDPLRIIATGLETLDTSQLETRLAELVRTGPVTEIVLGFPTRTDGTDTHVTQDVRDLGARLAAAWPGVQVHYWDERFSSRQAMEAMIRGGVKKKQRSDKQLINQVSATLILQAFMESRG